MKFSHVSLIISVMLVFIISLLGVSAITMTSTSPVVIGGSSQEASNYRDYQYGIYTDVSLNFDSAVINATLKSVTPVSPYTQSSQTVQENNINLSVSPSGSSVILKGRIPESLSAVDEKGKPAAFKVADVVITVNGEDKNFTLNMQRKNKLEFNELTLRYAPDGEDSLKNNDKVDELMPGQSASIEFEVENMYKSSEDVEFEDVSIYADADNDLDISEDDTIGQIQEDDIEAETLSFDIDEDASEGNYDLILKTIGNDEYNARHGEVYTIKVEIDKEKDDIAITRFDLSPDSVIVCDAQSVTATIAIKNVGSNDQDDISLYVQSGSLGYKNTIADIELDEDDSKTKSFPIAIAKKTKPGSYPITVSVLNDDGEETDSQNINVIVYACDGTLGTDNSYNNVDDLNNYQQTYQPIDVVVNRNGQSTYGQVISAQPINPSSLQTKPTVINFDALLKNQPVPLNVLLVGFIIVALIVVMLAIIAFKK